MSRPNPDHRRVVVTGLGVVSSLGIGWQEFWKNLLAGKSGISKITSFDTSQYDRHYAGEIKNFDPTQFMSKKRAALIGRSSQMAIAATKLALKDAGVTRNVLIKDRIGVCVGTTMGEPQILETMTNIRFKFGLNKIDPHLSLLYPSCVIVNNVACKFNITGNALIFANACSAGNYSVGYAYDSIKSGKTDSMIAGGVDEFSRLNITGFSRSSVVAVDKCRPFDKNREGIMVGEGAGIVFIETLEAALKNKRKIYAEILGYALSCDADHMIKPNERGIIKCLEKILRYTGLSPTEVDYICAHGTGTKSNDEAEARAIVEIFYKKGRMTPVSSIKSMLGHTMGAASALEIISCCLTLKNNMIPPTINYETLDSACEIDCVPNKARKAEIKIVLNNSFAFGGNNACVALKKY